MPCRIRNEHTQRQISVDKIRFPIYIKTTKKKSKSGALIHQEARNFLACLMYECTQNKTGNVRIT